MGVNADNGNFVSEHSGVLFTDKVDVGVVYGKI